MEVRQTAHIVKRLEKRNYDSIRELVLVVEVLVALALRLARKAEIVMVVEAIGGT